MDLLSRFIGLTEEQLANLKLASKERIIIYSLTLDNVFECPVHKCSALIMGEDNFMIHVSSHIHQRCDICQQDIPPGQLIVDHCAANVNNQHTFLLEITNVEHPGHQTSIEASWMNAQLTIQNLFACLLPEIDAIEKFNNLTDSEIVALKVKVEQRDAIDDLSIGNIYQCPVHKCSRLVADWSEMMTHIETHINEGRCDICYDTVTAGTTIEEHCTGHDDDEHQGLLWISIPEDVKHEQMIQSCNMNAQLKIQNIFACVLS